MPSVAPGDIANRKDFKGISAEWITTKNNLYILEICQVLICLFFKIYETVYFVLLRFLWKILYCRFSSNNYKYKFS